MSRDQRKAGTGRRREFAVVRMPRAFVIAGVVSIIVSALAPAIGLAALRDPGVATPAALAAPCPAAGCAITIDARDFATATPLTTFNYIINLDNTKLPTDPNALSTESNSPIVREGGDSRPTVNLPDGRYLISVRAPNHKMWGKHITLPADAGTVRIDLTTVSEAHPLPLGKIRVFVFNDTAWTNGAPDTEEAGLNGFQIGLEEQTGGAVTVDYNNTPLCGGVCVTGGGGGDAGFAEVNDLGPATYFIDVHPPDGPCNSDPDSQWYQTTTIDGGLQLLAPVEEGSDGTGAPGEQLWEPPNTRTAYWFGFVCAPHAFAGPGTGEITGTARNWVEWAPYTVGTFNEPVQNPFVALSDSSTDQTVYIGQGDSAGNFDIQNVPAGEYNLAIWDEQLTYIMRFKPVVVGAGETVDVNETGDDGVVGIGVSRWFGWLDGHVYKDTNGNGKMDAGEPIVANTDVDQRWRDGSIKEGAVTDPQGYYEYPTAEGGALGRWIIGEQGFARNSAFPGASRHDERTGVVTPSCAVEPPAVPANPCIPNAEGGGLLVNHLLLEGHRETVDWGKRNYPAGTPGQIVGITYFATTRNEFDARFQAHEDYEPAVPDVTVLLETFGDDGLPNTSDDVVVNKYVTDHWQQPNASQDPQPDGNTFTQDCGPIRDVNGVDISSQFNPDIGPNCLEVPLTGEQTKEGKFDGGYAFASYCPNGYDLAADDGTCVGGSEQVDLVAGDYITHVVMPTDATDTRACNPNSTDGGFKNASGPFADEAGAQTGCLYKIVREEDVNVDLGNQFAPQIPPPPCTGDDHVIDQSTLVTRSNHYGVAGAHAPLCDKRLITLQNGQNANADFNMMTNFATDPNGADSTDTRAGDVAEPGRLVGQVFNDIYFERNPMSPWYGEPRPIAGIPVGIYARVDTVCAGGGTACAQPNVNLPFDANRWRLFTTVTTSPDGSFEVLLPSTETYNCPIPQGPCPGMYMVTVDDPGSKVHPNANFNPNLLVATTPAEVWPGLTDQLDLPLDPISGTACEDPAVPARPELLQVSRPYVAQSSTGSARRITIKADFIGSGGSSGSTGGHLTLTDFRTGTVTTLTRSNGGVVSWTQGTGSTPDTIVMQVPALNTSTFRPGPKQLTIVTSNPNGGVSSVNGITIHVLGSNTNGTTVTYNPEIVNVAGPPPGSGTNAHAIQNAIDSASPGALLVLKAGVYNENVLMWKPVKLQGLGPGGTIGAHEFLSRDPEDPRFDVLGSVIDGRFFALNATAFDATVASRGSFAVDPNLPNILRGADLTVVAKSTSSYNLVTNSRHSDSKFSQARVDGMGLMTGRGDGAGGIQLQAYANNTQITNDVLENNGGIVAGGIGIGQPYAHKSHNYDVRVANDRLIGNGGLTTSGGIGIFYGSNNYELASSVICSNFSVQYGAGVSHIGKSPGANIHDNQIYYNDSVDSGAAIAIESELPTGNTCAASPSVYNCLGAGTGTVNVDRNLIQSNYSGDDGGGLFILDALTAEINVRNNMIVNNGASDLGGAITLDDASNVRLVNNTIANNVSTASSENSAIGVPRSAGLASESNDPIFQASLPAGSPQFSNPTALFNNIFWNNQAYTLSQFGPGATLINQGFIDFEIHDPSSSSRIYSNARYNLFTNGNVEQANATFANMPGGGAPTTGFPTNVANRGNIVGVNPLFITPFTNELTVTGSRLDPQAAAVTITGADPPVGLTGDYHLQTSLASNQVSGAVDRGVHCSNAAVPPPTNPTIACTGTGVVTAPTGANADIDGDTRPQLRSLRVRTRWDFGADEVAP
jgi:polysaccharide lyase family 4-like protein